MGRAELVQVAHAIELIELIGDPGDTVTVDHMGADGATTAATPVDVRIVYRD